MTAPIVLAAGGTGGHLFPAVALAGALQTRQQAPVFVTDRRGAGYASAFGGFELHRVPAGSPTAGRLGARLRGAAEIGVGILLARRLLRRLWPKAVVGFGGYPSLPTMLAAVSLKLPTLLHEQNAVLGRVNRLLAPRVDLIAASLPLLRGVREAERRKLTVTGNPVRAAVAALSGRAYEPPSGAGSLRLLVFGGSQGARIIADVVPAAVAALPEQLRGRLKVAQQCRAEDVPRVEAAYGAAGIAASVSPFFEDLPERLADAHLVIARSGAGTVAELTVIGRPAILVPFRAAMDDHQSANAMVLAEAGAAVVVPEPDFTAETLCRELEALLQTPDRLAEAAAGARAVGRADAADRLADLVEQLARGAAGETRRPKAEVA